MNQRYRKAVAVLAAGLVLVTGVAVWAADYAGFPTVNVVVNGVALHTDVPAVIIDGRTLLPVRAVAEALGAQVTWDAGTGTVTLTTAGDPAALRRQLDDANAAVARAQARLDAAGAAAAALQPRLDAARSALARAQGDQNAAREQVDALTRQVSDARAQLDAANTAVARSAGGARRDALKAALLATGADQGLANLQGLFSALLGSGDLRSFSFVRTWDLPAAAREQVVLKDPAGTVLSRQSQAVPAGLSTVKSDYSLRLDRAGLYVFEISLDDSLVTTLNLPVISPQTGLATAHARFLPGDSGVSGDAVQATADAFEQAAYPAAATLMGLQPAVKLQVKLFSDRTAWHAAMVADGLPESTATRVSGHFTSYDSGQIIYALVTATDGASLATLRGDLGWELGFVAARAVAGDAAYAALPHWMRLGLAQYVYLKSQVAGAAQPRQDGLRLQSLAPVLTAAAKGGLQPLPATAADAARITAYDPDVQGMAAVERVLSLGGPQALATYLADVRGGATPAAALQAVTGQSPDAFAAGLSQSLAATAGAADHGFSFTLQVAAGFVGDLEVDVGWASQAYILSGVIPGAYRFTVSAAGAVSADHGALTQHLLEGNGGSSELRITAYPTYTVLLGGKAVDNGTFYIRRGAGQYYYTGARIWYSGSDNTSFNADADAALPGMQLTALQRQP